MSRPGADAGSSRRAPAAGDDPARRPRSLARRVAFLIAAGLLALLVHAATVFVNSIGAEEAIERLPEQVAALRAANAFAIGLLRVDDVAFRFAVTGDPAWREAFEAEHARLGEAARLLRTAADTPREQAIVDAILRAFGDYFARIERLVRESKPLGPAELEQFRRERSDLPRLQALAEEFAEIQAADLERSRVALGKRVARDRRSIFLTLAAVGAASALLGALLLQRVVRPLSRLRRAVDALGRGDVRSRVPVTGADEVGALSDAFNRMATQLAEERARLIVISLTDALTGLANRRHFDRQLAQEISRARRYRRALSLVMVDLDHFKRLNDTYGHQTGDRVLQALARTIEREVRPSDFAARIGGEEFAIVFPETSLRTAVHVAERLRKAVEAAGGQDGLPAITASFGVAAWSEGLDGNQLLAAADAALYRAKQAGRNRVAAAEEPREARAPIDLDDPRR